MFWLAHIWPMLFQHLYSPKTCLETHCCRDKPLSSVIRPSCTSPHPSLDLSFDAFKVINLCVSLIVGSANLGLPSARHLQVMMLPLERNHLPPKITASFNTEWEYKHWWELLCNGGHFGGALPAACSPCCQGNRCSCWNRLLWVRRDWKRWWFVSLFCLLNSVCGFRSHSYSNIMFLSLLMLNYEIYSKSANDLRYEE